MSRNESFRRGLFAALGEAKMFWMRPSIFIHRIHLPDERVGVAPDDRKLGCAMFHLTMTIAISKLLPS